MKKIFLISLFLVTCHSINNAQQSGKVDYEQKLKEVNQQIKKSDDTTSVLITRTKELANKKIVYRTITIMQHDTAWRVDTCVTVYRPIDSATIAIMFKQPEIKKEVKIGKRVRIIFLRKKKIHNDE